MTSPSARLLAGAFFTLLVIVAYAGYTVSLVQRMRQVQTHTIEQNRKAALQLIRIQSDLNALALAMRDILDNVDNYPVTAYAGPLDRIRDNLDDAIRAESLLSGGRRDPEQTAFLMASFSQFWTAVEQVRRMAETGEDPEARQLVRNTLLPRQETLSSLTARLLVQNNEAEHRAVQEVLDIYAGIERNAYWFLAISVVLVLAVSGRLIRSNRVLFERVTELSDQRRELARQLIATQESTLRSISRDLHDEFGQILTAVGAMLKRAGRLAPSEFQEQLRETNVTVQETLEKIRALSQSLQPVILEEQGLAAAVQWHVSVFQRQTGIRVDYQLTGEVPEIPATRSIHVFRILQEALNNAARHGRSRTITVQLEANRDGLALSITDNGTGIPASFKPGIGLSGMRERAALVDGVLEIGPVMPTGTRVSLTMPIKPETPGDQNE